MNTLLNHIRQHSTGPLATTLVIGAGNGSALANWRELGSTRLVMAEAHPRQAEELARRLRSDLGEELLAVAITPADQPTAALYALNNPAYSSLQAPRGLLDCYPNLRTEAPLQTPATSLTSLLEQQALEASGDHLLLLSAPGQAFALLHSAPHDLLQAFRWLLISTNSEPLYENEREPAAVTALLHDAGFDLAAEDPDALYPQASLLFERNPNAVRTLRLEREVDTLRNRLTATTQQAAKREAELQTQLSEQSAALAEQTRLATERQAQLDQLTKEKAELTAARDALAKDKTALTQARDEQSQLATERKAQLDKITTERDQLQKSLNENKKALEGAKQQIQQLEEEASESLHRQQLLHEELIKAEAQIELIKDLLLREPGL